MKLTSLTYTRSAKVTDPVNRYENHDVSITATIQGEWIGDHEADKAFEGLQLWVLSHVSDNVLKIREG